MFGQQPSRVPAVPEPITHIQPDGDTLTFYLRGDEWYHCRLTLDGYLITQNKKGYYCYARQNKKGEITPTCRIAHNADKRSASEIRYLSRMPKGMPHKKNNHKNQ